MLKRWPQVCRVKITFTSPPANHFVPTKTISMKCFVNWNLLRFHVGGRNIQPHLNWYVLSLTLTRAYLLVTLQNLYKSNPITPVRRFETTNCNHNNSNDSNSQQHTYACICAAVCQCVSGYRTPEFQVSSAGPFRRRVLFLQCTVAKETRCISVYMQCMRFECSEESCWWV